MIAQVRVIGIKLGARMFDDLGIWAGQTAAATAAPRRESERARV